MKEWRSILDAWRAAGGQPVVLATLVETRGSAYRHAGARMLLTPGGWVAGSVTGGCLESDLVRSAWERTEAGPAILEYDTTSDADAIWGFGLGCRGVIRVLVERLEGPDPCLEVVDRCLRAGEPCTLATVLREGPMLGRRAAWCNSQTAGDALVREYLSPPWPETGHEVREAGDIAILVEAVRAPVRLVILGGDHDAVPLARLGRSLGWRVIVADTREGRPAPDLFADADERITAEPTDLPAALRLDASTSVVLMSHSYLQDLTLLHVLLRSPVPYIGVLASRGRVARMAEDLGGLPPSIHAPVGLDIGAEGPDEIALAVAAEILAVARVRRGGPLRAEAGG